MLSLIGTPIGNLEDITLRALRLLKEAQVILAEDTRHARRLLDHYAIKPAELLSYHEHNEAERTAEIMARLRAEPELKVALISDAGMPAVSDPGWRIIDAALRDGSVSMEVIPGVSALTTAVAGAGLDLQNGFCFRGFLPNTSGRRENVIAAALQRPEASVFYESPNRLLKSLGVIAGKEPQRTVVVARELTKKFEEFRRGPAKEVYADYATREGGVKGEITLIISGSAQRQVF